MSFPPIPFRTRGTLTCLALGLFTAALAWTAFAHGDVHERITGLSQQLAANPSNAVLLLQRADLRRQHGELSAALADAREAGRWGSGWLAVPLQEARIQFEMADFSNALTSADAVLRQDPANADALVIRSRCLVLSGRTNEAITDLTRVLSRKERAMPELYLERARLQADAGDMVGAVSGLDAGIRKLGNTPSLALPAMEYERQQGAYDAALSRLESVAKHLPPETAMILRGEVLAEAGQPEAARLAFQDALDLLGRGKVKARRPAGEAAALEARARLGLKQIEKHDTPSILKQ